MTKLNKWKNELVLASIYTLAQGILITLYINAKIISVLSRQEMLHISMIISFAFLAVNTLAIFISNRDEQIKVYFLFQVVLIAGILIAFTLV